MRSSSHPSGRVTSLLVLTSGALITVCPSNAYAHVKWFAPYNVATEPRALSLVLSLSFTGLFALSLVVMLAAVLIERTRVGVVLLETIDRLTDALRPRSEALLRACGGAFFIAIFVLGNVILTPELKTQSGVIPWLQAAIAIGLFCRPTMILSGLGIVALYAIGVANYGVFHLLDYPIFLGLAVFYMLSGAKLNLFGLRPLDIARWGAGLTLMWASIEKWAYPQ